jgi:hypothetical protein
MLQGGPKEIQWTYFVLFYYWTHVGYTYAQYILPNSLSKFWLSFHLGHHSLVIA